MGTTSTWWYTAREIKSLMQTRRGWVLTVCLLGVLVTMSTAQAERQRPPEESCAEGWYTGPRAGRKNYSHDKYIWVVTEDFAKRFCMPPEFVDKDLKGAEAIAFRMSTGDNLCAVIEGQEQCTGDNELRFDIFLRSDLNLPAAHSEVKFYDGRHDDAGWHIAVDEGLPTRGARYRNGQYRLPPGTIPHFKNPYAHPDPGVLLELVGTLGGKAKWLTGLDERRYEADWTRGLDLLVVQGDPLVGSLFTREEAKRADRYAILFHRDQYDNKRLLEMRVPEEFAHTIWLPDKFFQQVRATVGNKSWGEQIRLYQRQ